MEERSTGFKLPGCLGPRPIWTYHRSGQTLPSGSRETRCPDRPLVGTITIRSRRASRSSRKAAAACNCCFIHPARGYASQEAPEVPQGDFRGHPASREMAANDDEAIAWAGPVRPVLDLATCLDDRGCGSGDAARQAIRAEEELCRRPPTSALRPRQTGIPWATDRAYRSGQPSQLRTEHDRHWMDIMPSTARHSVGPIR